MTSVETVDKSDPLASLSKKTPNNSLASPGPLAAPKGPEGVTQAHPKMSAQGVETLDSGRGNSDIP